MIQRTHFYFAVSYKKKKYSQTDYHMWIGKGKSLDLFGISSE